MKKYKKHIIIAFLSILLLTFILSYFFQKYYHETSYEEYEGTEVDESILSDEELDELKEKYGQIKRINILVAGIESSRTDTLMVFSYDQDMNLLDIISVPRDTYVDNGYKDAGRKKINSVYGYPDNKGGIKATAKAVSKVLSIPIHEYITIDYDGVKEVVNAIGGVEIYIPFDMKYDDSYATPELHIDFKKGKQTLNGSKAIEYLRWRKNNKGSMGDEGDLGRIKRQQEFVIIALKKAIKPTNITKVITIGLSNTKTSMNLKEALYYATKMTSIKNENINAYSLIGEDKVIDGIWYFIYDSYQTKQLIRSIYMGIKPISEDK